jgi:hypothetical protein
MVHNRAMTEESAEGRTAYRDIPQFPNDDGGVFPRDCSVNRAKQPSGGAVHRRYAVNLNNQAAR